MPISTDSFQSKLKEAAHHLNFSNHFLARNDVNSAKQHLYEALRLNPNYAEAYNNLGRLLYKQQLFQESIHYFKKALRLEPTLFETHYNLGHAFSQLNQFDQALTHYQYALLLNPNHFGTHHNIGLIFFERQHYEQSQYHLEKASAINLLDISTQLILGQNYLALGKTDLAKKLYQDLLSETGNIAQAHHHAEAHHNLAVLYLWEKNTEKACDHFEKAFSLNPANETAAHMIRALKGENFPSVSNHYVRDLFDQYAEYYTPHVKQQLGYQAPFLLRDAFGRYQKNKLKAGRLLDLGCGTGLCGIYFRDLAKEFIGVDISSKMVEQAKALKDAYETVHIQDILEFLTSFEDPISLDKQFDLVIASDVFGYFGDLTEVFSHVSRILALQGHFLFTIEHDPHPFHGFQLQKSGRFTHTKKYIEDLCQPYSFMIVWQEDIRLRKDNSEDVLGNLYILKKV